MGKKGFSSEADEPKSIVCLGEEIKMALRAILGDYPDGEGNSYGELLDSIPTCDSGEPVGFGDLTDSSDDQPKKSSSKTKKKRTAYQDFVSGCMKGKNIKGFGESASAMKECAAEWQANKT